MPDEDGPIQVVKGVQKPTQEFIEIVKGDDDNIALEPRSVRPKTRGGVKHKSKGSFANRLAGDGTKKAEEDEKKYVKGKRKEAKKFAREGDEVSHKGIQEPRLRGHLKKTAKQNREAAFLLSKSQVLQTTEAGFMEAEGTEKTLRYSQAEILENTSIGVAKKKFSLDLPYGPYVTNYTKNGRHLVAGGRKGHVALLNTDNMKLLCELQKKETIRAVQTLHNHMLFAVAQKKYTYIYDHTGTEIHVLKDQQWPTFIDYLPYHFLMVTTSELNDLWWRDVSTGEQVSSRKTLQGPTTALRQNPNNAVMHLGHASGVVSLWTPTVKNPVAKVFAHHGQVASIAISNNYMVTAGRDSYWKVWDVRKFEELQSYRCYGHAANDIDISMTGLISLGFGSHLQIWKDALTGGRPKAPYMKEEYPGQQVTSVKFQPYEDVLCVGHTSGFGTLVVPGAGFANFDSSEANPFETKQQRQSKEVKDLLDKLQPDSIMLDVNTIGNINAEVSKKYLKEKEERRKAEEDAKKKKKKKMRGKDKSGNKQKRKQLQGAKDQRDKTRARLDGQDSDSDDDSDDATGMLESGDEAEEQAKRDDPAMKHGTALGRFYGTRKRKT
eukprot:TRINITY_DN81443_c0_g1_i1.p1 TRINITY_DN81443_c0_g1~~TRINITY_DN81443_c0_g1_i1.p1  ORF type:complete len:606 (+),score=192.26 TRINITY_DN81443_c0_g1_i1:96-1913(+)